MEGRADIEYIPASIGMSLPYPYRDCPACEATVWKNIYIGHLI